MKIILAIAAFGVLLSSSMSAQANPLVPFYIYEINQKGDGAQIAVATEEASGYSLSLQRKTGEDYTLLADQVDTTTIVLEPFCLFEDIDETSCGANPSDCFDCDGDEVPECTFDCLQAYIVDDACVPAGASDYSLFYHVEGDCGEASQENFTAQDVGQECATGTDEAICVEGSDGDSDSDSDVDADADTDTESTDTAPVDGSTDGCSAIPGVRKHWFISFMIDAVL